MFHLPSSNRTDEKKFFFQQIYFILLRQGSKIENEGDIITAWTMDEVFTITINETSSEYKTPIWERHLFATVSVDFRS